MMGKIGAIERIVVVAYLVFVGTLAALWGLRGLHDAKLEDAPLMAGIFLLGVAIDAVTVIVYISDDKTRAVSRPTSGGES